MTDELKTTVRIQRPPRVQSDGRGRSVWAEPIDTVEFELLSTGELQKILESTDETAKKSIAVAASSGDDGVLARNTATGHFEILSDADLQRIIEQDLKPLGQEKVADVIYEPVFDGGTSIDELSLVSTLALKKILKAEDEEVPVALETDSPGFDPYDRS
jgi:hypothetical protein